MLSMNSHSESPAIGQGGLKEFGFTLLICLATAALLSPFAEHFDLANIVMIFLLVVLLVSVRWGRGCGVFASVLCVLLFDVVFVPPRFSLVVEDAQYLVTFAVMLATALITAQLASGLKQNERLALRREQRAQELSHVARQLAGAMLASQVDEVAQAFIKQQFGADAWLIHTQEEFVAADRSLTKAGFFIETHLATAAIRGGKVVHSTAGERDGWASVYLPLKLASRTWGVLAVAFPPESKALVADDLSMMEAMATLVAVTLERLHYVSVANHAELDMRQERLRASILSALSHDLRTPLTVLMGLADSLGLIRPSLPPQALETANEMHQQAKRLSNHVSNLLDMARLSEGDVQLRKEWHALQEVIGASLQYLGSALGGHKISVAVANDFPLVEIDAVLIERVFSNLLENAAKFSPTGSVITVTATLDQALVRVRVQDQGEDFPESLANAAFEPFSPGSSLQGLSGFGLGLSICRIVMEAHGGSLRVVSENGAGGCVELCFPRGQPPAMECVE